MDSMLVMVVAGLSLVSMGTENSCAPTVLDIVSK